MKYVIMNVLILIIFVLDILPSSLLVACVDFKLNNTITENIIFKWIQHELLPDFVDSIRLCENDLLSNIR